MVPVRAPELLKVRFRREAVLQVHPTDQAQAPQALIRLVQVLQATIHLVQVQVQAQVIQVVLLPIVEVVAAVAGIHLQAVAVEVAADKQNLIIGFVLQIRTF